MGSGTITGGEDFSRKGKCCCVWTKIFKEIGEAVEEKEGLLAGLASNQSIIPET